MRLLFRVALLLLTLPVLAQQQKPTVMIVGTFHMANPSRDIFNVHVDDVLQPRRQREIEEVVALLAKFRPTKIVLEAELDNPKTRQRYADYLAGNYTLAANERDQLGFRLARQLGHKQVYSVDVEGDFPWDKVVEFAKQHGQSDLIDDTAKDGKAWVAELQSRIDHGSILDVLRYLNRDDEILKSQQFYVRMMKISADGQYPGPDLDAEWYKRNARIFSNIRHLITSPGDRILVIYGSGHGYWLEHNVLESADLTLAKFNDLR